MQCALVDLQAESFGGLVHVRDVLAAMGFKGGKCSKGGQTKLQGNLGGKRSVFGRKRSSASSGFVEERFLFAGEENKLGVSTRAPPTD